MKNSKMSQVFEKFDTVKYADYKPYICKQNATEWDNFDDEERQYYTERYKTKENYIKEHDLDSGEDFKARSFWRRDQFNSDNEYREAIREYIDYADELFKNIDESIPKPNKILEKIGLAKTQSDVYWQLYRTGKLPDANKVLHNLDLLYMAGELTEDEFDRIARGF